MAEKPGKKTCFVIGPIGDEETEIRKWADEIFDCVIEPAVTECGYQKPIRADHIAKSGMITIDIIQHLVSDTLVIADLTSTPSTE